MMEENNTLVLFLATENVGGTNSLGQTLKKSFMIKHIFLLYTLVANANPKITFMTIVFIYQCYK